MMAVTVAEGRAPLRPALRSSPARRVLVAIALDEASAVALRRAADVARDLEAELHVIHVIPALGTRSTAAPASAWCGAEASTLSHEARVALDAAHRFIQTSLGCHFFPRDRLIVREGDVARRVQETAEQLDAALVLLGSSAGGAGRCVLVVPLHPTASAAISAPAAISG